MTIQERREEVTKASWPSSIPALKEKSASGISAVGRPTAARAPAKPRPCSRPKPAATAQVLATLLSLIRLLAERIITLGQPQLVAPLRRWYNVNQQMKILVFGATGAAGGSVLRVCLASQAVEGRHPLTLAHGKLRVFIHNHAVSNSLARPAVACLFALLLASRNAQAVQFTGVQTNPGEWTYTLTYDPLDNYSICQAQTTITLSGLAGVTRADPPTSTDYPNPFGDAVNLLWSPQVLGGGTTVTWTHVGPGTGNWDIPIHVFGFRVTAPSSTSGAVAVATDGFSKDVGTGETCPAMERDIVGTTVGPSALACPGASSVAPLSLAVGRNPLFAAVGDFDGDGWPDLAVANAGSADVSILLGNGDGTFQNQVRYAAGAGPRSLAVGDFDADSHLDIAVANARSANISILLGNGDGTFQTQVRYPAGGALRSLVARDFDGDGNLDLAVASANAASVLVLLGDGAGELRTGGRYRAEVVSDPAATADFNGDGTLDLAAARSASDDVSVVLGAAPCNRPPVAICRDITLAAGSTCQASVTAADVDGGSFDPEGNPITLTLDSTGPFGLGAHLVTLVATDILGDATSCQARVTVVDRLPPRVTASLTEVRRLNKNSRVFRVGASATDNCGVSRKSSLMKIPSPLQVFPIRFSRLLTGIASVGINYRDKKITLRGPSESRMRELLRTLLEQQGAAVTDGQQITIVNGTNSPKEQSVLTFTADPRSGLVGSLRGVNAQVLRLRVEAFDAAGNRKTATATPSFR